MLCCVLWNNIICMPGVWIWICPFNLLAITLVRFSNLLVLIFFYSKPLCTTLLFSRCLNDTNQSGIINIQMKKLFSGVPQRLLLDLLPILSLGVCWQMPQSVSYARGTQLEIRISVDCHLVSFFGMHAYICDPLLRWVSCVRTLRALIFLFCSFNIKVMVNVSFAFFCQTVILQSTIHKCAGIGNFRSTHTYSLTIHRTHLCFCILSPHMSKLLYNI